MKRRFDYGEAWRLVRQSLSLTEWKHKIDLREEYFVKLPPEYFGRRYQTHIANSGARRDIDSFKHALFARLILEMESLGYIERRWIDKPNTRNSRWEARLTEKGFGIKNKEFR